MIGGIFGTIGKKLGIGQEKYFLELDDAAEKGVENLKGAATKATKVAREAASEIADKAQDLASETVDKAQEAISAGQAKTKTAQKTSEKAPVAGKATVAAKQGSNLVTEAAEEPVAKPAPAVAQPRDPGEIIRSAIAAGGKKTDSSGNVIDTAQTFATDFLMPLANSNRRRPGPSLSSFKTMAKEVNPRLKG
jgi:hypothetical protein